MYLLKLRRPILSQQKEASVLETYRSIAAMSIILTEHEDAMGYTVEHEDRDQQSLTPNAGGPWQEPPNNSRRLPK